jgi:uncharacterized protein (TIGR00369 family)
MSDAHFKKLESMYLSARVNTEIYNTTKIKIEAGKATIKLTVDKKYFHALNALHGSVYFKLLDDASFFAVNSVVPDVFVLTASYHIHFLRPVTQGELRAVGKMTGTSGKFLSASADLYDDKGKKVAFGAGKFVKSKMLLTEEMGYK